jgi:Ser/Thr protein kinase RdoA (MazF antagonist)
MRIVTEHIYERKRNSDIASVRDWKVPRVIRTHNGRDYCIASDNTFWRVIGFIENTECFDTIEDSGKAMEVGSVLGIFHNLISDLPVEKLTDTLEGFHITPRYLNHYDQVMKKKKADKSHETKYCEKFVNERRAWANILEDAKKYGKLPLRPIHGDPKISNILMDKTSGHAVSIIDLDTVKPGLIHYDIGDCIRSACNHLTEDAEEQWESVKFDSDTCRSILQGYISQTEDFLSETDYEYLYDAIRLIAFELGLRFFTDYLEDNIYFKVRYPEHNLFRSLVQFRLTESIEMCERDIRKIIEDLQ